MHHHRYATVAALSPAILGFGATGASAQDNTRYTRTLDPRVVTVCANGDTITLGFDITVNRHIQEYDESGQPLLETRNIVGVGTFTDVATGAEISFRDTRILTIDWSTSISTSRGNYRIVTLPGVGAVMLSAGRFVEDRTLPLGDDFLFLAGPKDSEESDPALACRWGRRCPAEGSLLPFTRRTRTVRRSSTRSPATRRASCRWAAAGHVRSHRWR